MRLILFAENPTNPSLEENREVAKEIEKIFLQLGEYRGLDWYGSKYLIAVLKMSSRRIAELEGEFKRGDICVSCRYFLEFRQFKRFILNLEKKFLYFTHPTSPKEVLEEVLPFIIKTHGSVLTRVTLESYAPPDSQQDPNLQYYQVILELQDKKNGFTSSKLQEFNQQLEGKVFLQKIKVLAPFLPAYKDRLAPKQHWDCYNKPTTKLYHHLLKADMAKLVDLSQNYCFNIEYDPALEQ